jgi:hypothetical protein
MGGGERNAAVVTRTQRSAFCNNRVRSPHVRQFLNYFSVIINPFVLIFFRTLLIFQRLFRFYLQQA